MIQQANQELRLAAQEENEKVIEAYLGTGGH